MANRGPQRATVMPSLTNTPQDGGQPNPQLAGLMFLQPDVIALPVFAVVMLIAAFEDFRRLVIPNLLPLVLCVAWPLHFAAAPSLVGALSAIGCALAVFIVGAALFSRGFLGGGDVKLLTAAAGQIRSGCPERHQTRTDPHARGHVVAGLAGRRGRQELRRARHAYTGIVCRVGRAQPGLRWRADHRGQNHRPG